MHSHEQLQTKWASVLERTDLPVTAVILESVESAVQKLNDPYNNAVNINNIIIGDANGDHQ